MLGRLAIAFVAAVALLTAVPVAHATVPAGNLLLNPGGEAAAGATDSSTQVPIPSWTVEGFFTTVAYDTPDFPTAANSTAVGGGQNFFAGGPDGDVDAATQTVDVSGAAAEIDAGTLPATLSALLGGFADQEDATTVTATFLGSAGSLGTLALPAVTAADRGSETALLARTATATVPPGTRSISVRIEATRTAGQYNDGYADNISLVLGGAPPPVFHKTVVVHVVSGKVLVKKPGGGFVTFDGTQDIPLGSTVDTRKGVIQLTAISKSGGPPETAKFYDGEFKITQAGVTTNLALNEPLASCKTGKASAAATKKKPKTRKLWGDGSGAFSTSGQYSAATVRGTKWLVQDSCSGTLTKVLRGVVAVRDNVRHKTIIVKAGHSYTARPKK
jgi:hypothetical protein